MSRRVILDEETGNLVDEKTGEVIHNINAKDSDLSIVIRTIVNAWNFFDMSDEKFFGFIKRNTIGRFQSSREEKLIQEEIEKDIKQAKKEKKLEKKRKKAELKAKLDIENG